LSMFCPQCGQENEQGAVFCSRCGYRFQPPEVKRGTKNLYTWILIGILVVALGIGVYFLIGALKLSPAASQMNLPQLIPGNSGVYLSFTSTQGSLLEFVESLRISSTFPGIEDPFKELETDPLAQELLSAVKPNIQLALAWNRDKPDFYLLGEVKDPTQAENFQAKLVSQYEQQGKRVEQKKVGNTSITGFPDEEVWIALKGNFFYAASSEETLLSLFGENRSSLENNPLFRSIKEKVPKATSLFVFVNFSLIPDIPSEVSHFYLFADELEGLPHYKGELILDLKKLLSSPPSRELEGVYDVLLKLINSSAETDTPFRMVPPDSALALTSFGWLGELLKSVGTQDFAPPSVDLSFLDGKMEFYLTAMENVEAPFPFGVTFEVDQLSYPRASQTINQIEQFLSQGAGEDFSFETVNIEGVLARKIATPEGNFYYALTEKHLLITTGLDSMKGLINREKGLENALAGEEQFRHYASLLGKYHLFLYLNGEKLQQLMEKLETPDTEVLPTQLKGTSLLLLEFSPDSVRFEGLTVSP